MVVGGEPGRGPAREVGRFVVRAATTSTAWLRPLPELMVVGVKRGGTTSLFRDLERHPAMLPLVPSARWLPLRDNQKGVHYFDGHPERSASWYRGHFATSMARSVRRRRAGAAFAGEASPYTFFHPLGAERVARTLPTTATFVVLLRDPVERTISHWAEQTRNGVETLSLRHALEVEDERVGDAARRLAAGELRTSFAHEQQSYLGQSRYAESLTRWFTAVGRERIVVAFSEDYYRDPSVVLGAITSRLGVAPVPSAPGGTHRNAAPRPAVIDADVERHLVDALAPDVERVAALVGATPPWPRFTRGISSDGTAVGSS